MEAENATSNEKNSTGDTESRDTSYAQERVLDAIKRSQDATFHVVAAWGESVSMLVATLPDMPTPPTLAGLPSPGDVTDGFLDFAQELMASQQEFVKKLLDALPGREKDHD